MKCKHSAEKCGIIAAVCYKEKQRISRDKTHETDHTTQEDKTMDGCSDCSSTACWGMIFILLRHAAPMNLP